jgi:hypothetical protein
MTEKKPHQLAPGLVWKRELLLAPGESPRDDVRPFYDVDVEDGDFYIAESAAVQDQRIIGYFIGRNAERDAIVEWLRAEVHATGNSNHREILASAADAIEARDHLREGGAGEEAT